MRSKKNPRLYVLPRREVLKPTWEEKKAPHTMNEQAIKKQMDKLHNVSSAVFVVTILLEICIWQFISVMDHALSFAGVIAAIAVSLAVGLLGGILVFLTASVETSVRQNLTPNEQEGERNV